MDNDEKAQNIYLVRHGNTAWALSGQHTSITDLPLIGNPEKELLPLSRILKEISFSRIYCSPLQRARKTCEIIGLLPQAIISDDLIEWRYGSYEGLTTAEIQRDRPQWSLFQHGAPNGESIADARERADRMIHIIREVEGNVILFSSGHFLRALAARWVDLPVDAGRHLVLDCGSLSILGFERKVPVIKLWNFVAAASV